MAEPSTTYEPRCPAQRALYQIVHDHFETFRVQAACLRDGEGLPRFVEQEFRDFLQPGAASGSLPKKKIKSDASASSRVSKLGDPSAV